jgi:hypothetical protein
LLVLGNHWHMGCTLPFQRIPVVILLAVEVDRGSFRDRHDGSDFSLVSIGNQVVGLIPSLIDSVSHPLPVDFIHRPSSLVDP